VGLFGISFYLVEWGGEGEGLIDTRWMEVPQGWKRKGGMYLYYATETKDSRLFRWVQLGLPVDGAGFTMVARFEW